MLQAVVWGLSALAVGAVILVLGVVVVGASPLWGGWLLWRRATTKTAPRDF